MQDPAKTHREPCFPSVDEQTVSIRIIERHETIDLEERMSGYDAQKPLEPFAPSFDDLIRETVGEDLSWEGGDIDSCRFPFQNISERFKVGVSSSDKGMA